MEKRSGTSKGSTESTGEGQQRRRSSNRIKTSVNDNGTKYPKQVTFKTPKIHFPEKRKVVGGTVKEIVDLTDNVGMRNFPASKKTPNIDDLDINSILALGESKKSYDQIPKRNVIHCEEFDDSDTEEVSDESEKDWEEVTPNNELNNVENKTSENEYKIPEEGVQITLSKEGVTQRKGKKGYDVDAFVRREMNRNTKWLYVDYHKVSLLLLVARGRWINNILNMDHNLAAGFSLLPTINSCPPKHVDVTYLERFINWFRKAIKINAKVLDSFTEENCQEPNSSKFEKELSFQLEKKEAKDTDNLAYIFILILRSCGVQVRLVWSLQPIPFKPPTDVLLKKEIKKEEEDKDLPCSSKSEKQPTKKRVPKVGKKAKEKTTKSDPSQIPKKTRKMVSSSEDEEEEEVKVTGGHDIWPEVWLEEEERWASVDILDGKLLCDSVLEAKATKKISYVLSFDNGNYLKDVTRRYDLHWLTSTQKLRASDWWNDTIQKYRGKRSAADKMEDCYLDDQLLSQAFPKSINEFKRHPLYVLRRHLLKFEAIYPPAPPPLGFIKKEAIYARELVRTLHSRELWLKQAKTVRMGEEPYKIVKSRPKYDRSSGQMQPSLPLDLFGDWQVEDYVPPTAENGVVPRNEYGNVELFLAKMLPKGTVHLQLPGLNRVAKKLGIDCAPALTGFDFHCGSSHPTYDGFVVCEEFKEILTDAWDEDQMQQVRREEEKRLKRIHDNWVKLVKGLLIREKLQKKYNMFVGQKRKAPGNNQDTDRDPEPGPSKKQRKDKE